MPPSSPQQTRISFNRLISQILYYIIRNVFAGSSGENLPCTGAGHGRIVYSFDEEDYLLPRSPPFGYRLPLIDESNSDNHWPARNPTVRNCRTRRNMVIETETGADEDASADDNDNDCADLVKFIVADNVYYVLNVLFHSIRITSFKHHI